jgi:hypothetical protein
MAFPEPNTELHQLALETLYTLIRTLTLSMTSVPMTDPVLGHPGIYSKLLKLQCTIMSYTTLQHHLTRANAGLGS